MYELSPEERQMMVKQEENENAINKYNRSLHKCNTCEWSKWDNDKLVFCTYSPISCVKE